jgi:rare lipoprotein A
VEGVASWYGPGFHGLRTTSGEVYDQHDLTAAHRTLPLGSRVAVTNLENDRVVEVRINDRGPFVKGRTIDLSYAAAWMLDIIEPGTAPVRIELVGDESSVFPRARYEVQVGAFADRQHAVELRKQLLSRFGNVHLTTRETPGGTYCRVRIGPYEQREEAVSTARAVLAMGLPALVVEEEGLPR